MNAMNQFQSITHSFHKSIRTLAAGALALGLGLFAGAGNSFAQVVHTWNVSNGYWTDPAAWSPAGVPSSTVSDTATFTGAAAGGPTFVVNFTNNVINFGTLSFSASAANNTATFTFNLGTNSFTGLNLGNGTSGSAFVIGDHAGGTAIVYIASSNVAGAGFYATNVNLTSLRMTVGRNEAGIIAVTNGYVSAEALVMANTATGSGSKVIVSGSNSSWTNSGIATIGNVASANLCSIVVSNSGSMTIMGTFGVGPNTSGTNTVLVDSNGRLFTRGAVTVGNGASAVGCAVTVQGGGLWDAGARPIPFGAGSGSGNNLTIGNGATVTNITTLTISAGGNALILSNGVLFVSTSVANASGTVSGSGTIVGNTVFTGTGTLTPGSGNLVGTLTVAGNLNLVSTSTTTLKLNKSPTVSNDLLNVVGTLAEAGTITVNNVGAALVGGDTFQTLAFGSKSGDFTVTNLPSLTGSLVWNTSQLGPQGIISVALPPTITGPSDQATNVGATVVISTTVTGVPVPVLQWQLGGVNVTDGPTGNGSTISGSTSSTLTILNAQTADTGQYCLIASNSASWVTNCMTLTVSSGYTCPTITGPTDQYTILHSNATFSASAAGIPTPTVQWQENGVDIPNATNTSVTIANVMFSQDGFSYSIIASNIACTTTNAALLHVVIPPEIQTQPVSLVVTQTQSATFTVVSTNGVPAPTFQWKKGASTIANATNASYTIASALPSDMATYSVVVANVAGSVTSTGATLTVDSTMSAALTPTNNAAAVCYDTPLYMAFDRVPVSTGVGTIKIFSVTNSVTPVDTIDLSLGNLQARAVAGDSNGPFNLYPIIITTNVVAIYPHLDVLSSNQTYYVTVDPGTFTETNGALFAGITDTNAWRFTTKPTGPANPNNVTVAYDGSGDFCTVQGALDSLPIGNTTPTLVKIQNGTYTEFVDTKNKNNVTFRGQSRTGTIIQYLNNNTQNGTTHARMSFKVFSNDIVIENLTLINTTPQGGSQAETLMIESGAARFILNNAEVDSRQDTILANVNTSQGYFYNSLVQGNFDYVWGGGNCYYNQCEFRTIPTATSYNLVATRTDTGTGPGAGQWPGFGINQFTSNGFSFVHCKFTRATNSVTNITMAGANGTANGQSAWLYCSMDVSNSNGYITPTNAVLTSELLWEYGNSNADNTASASFGLVGLTNGDARLTAALDPTIWLSGWVPQLAPNIITNPVGATVTAGASITFSVVATGIPDPTDYQWYKDGNPLPVTSSATYTIPSTTGNDNGTYKVVVSNDAGSATSADAILVVTGTAPTANFTDNPSTGSEPLAVTFTDTSTGSLPISLAWDFDDGHTATSAGGSSVMHAYAAGTYTVTLIASNYFGTSTLIRPLIVAVDAAFEAWQTAHFGCTNCPQAAPGSDPDGDGQPNWAEYLAGTDPTSAGSYLHVISVKQQGNDMAITWATVGGTTNILQAAAGGVGGSYTAAFSGIVTNIIGGSGDVTNTYVISGDATNGVARYYRIVFLP